MSLGTLFPQWFSPTLVAGVGAQQSVMSPQRWKVFNRTGGAVVKNGMYQFDLAYSATAETTQNSTGLLHAAVSNMLWMDPASAWRNIVTPTDPMASYGVMCIAESDAADNEELWVTVVADTNVNMLTFQGGVAGSMLVTGANWTDATKTINKTGAFANFITPPSLVGNLSAKLRITAGTGVTLGDYDIATKTDNDNITLSADINGASGNIADNSINGEILLTYMAGSKVEAQTTFAGGALTNGNSSRRQYALTADIITFGNSTVAAHVLFCGWGLKPNKL